LTGEVRPVDAIANRMRVAEMKAAAALGASHGGTPYEQLEALERHIHFSEEARLLHWVLGDDSPAPERKHR
jgi:hypothetical protein